MVPSKNFSRQYNESNLRYVVKCLLLKGLTGGESIYLYKRDPLDFDGKYVPCSIPPLLQGVL